MAAVANVDELIDRHRITAYQVGLDGDNTQAIGCTTPPPDLDVAWTLNAALGPLPRRRPRR
jgi:hypothetical protein